MRKLFKISLLTQLLVVLAVANLLAGNGGVTSFNDGWLFFKGDILSGESVRLDDSQWRELDLPHDWAIEGPFSAEYNARTGGLPVHGTGWYRKYFVIDKEDEGKLLSVIFDGAMSNAEVWVNGVNVGERPYGYASFELDITHAVKGGGATNVIAVRLRPEDLSTRWYSGAGIYRNVWLSVNEPLHIPLWGIFVTTPVVSSELAVVNVMTELVNTGAAKAAAVIDYSVVDAAGAVVASKSQKIAIEALGAAETGAWINVDNPALWSVDEPNLYTLETKVSIGGEVVDRDVTSFGIRSIEFTRDAFLLNGEPLRFNGVCLHHDNGPLGAAQIDRADERKLQMMKEMGVNAVRTSHNPPSPEFLTICDRLGLLVIDEAFDTWHMAKTENDYAKHFQEWSERDLSDMMRRDRNHPSVIMWSVGNEILEQMDKQGGWLDAKRLADIARRVDHTRPSTIGFNFYPLPYDSNMANQVDVVGMNYKPVLYDDIRAKYPQMIIYGSETSSCCSSRGVYHLPIEKYNKHESLQVSSYDLIGAPWAYPPDVEFQCQEDNPYVLGEFMWTGFDYLGEPTPYGGRDNSTNGYWNGDWPSRSSYFGAVDLCGIPKDRFYLYQSHWTDESMIHLLPHWNWGKEFNGKPIPVYAYTNCEEAELFLNGESMGRRVKGRDLTPVYIDFNHCPDSIFYSKYRLSWDVPYKAGELKVVGYRAGEAIVEKVIRTAGAAAAIKLEADRAEITADGRDLSYVTVSIVDKDGNLCPTAENLVNFEVEGEGSLRAVGNGNAATLESFQAPHRKAFSGKCMAIIESSKQAGTITLKATSRVLKSESVTIETKKKIT